MNREEYNWIKSKLKSYTKPELKELSEHLLEENQRLRRVIAGKEEGNVEERIDMWFAKIRRNLNHED